jgi:thiol-disulfide isomerase/thioredoxin
MLTEVLVRGLWAVGIAALLLGLYWFGNRLILARVRARRPSLRPQGPLPQGLRLGFHLGLETLKPGAPAILYFTTPTCAPCKTVQRPALARLGERFGDGLQVIEVDASARPDLADYWGVLSVPTTFVIDSKGQPRRVNHGVASADRLQKQIEAVEGGTYLAKALINHIRRTIKRFKRFVGHKEHEVHKVLNKRPS